MWRVVVLRWEDLLLGFCMAILWTITVAIFTAWNPNFAAYIAVVLFWATALFLGLIRQVWPVTMEGIRAFLH